LALRFSAKAEYACIGMIELAANYGEPQPVRLKAIADSHGISQRFLVQILLQLKGVGLVTSVRGASGGYQLARRPERICVADIVNAVDPPQGVRAAAEVVPGSVAAQALHAVWREVQAAQQRILEQTTLAELVRRTRDSGDSSYQI
jgi:Rrf2 family protein